MCSDLCLCSRTHLYLGTPENEEGRLKLGKLPDLSLACLTEGLGRGRSHKVNEHAGPVIRWYRPCWNSGMHFQHKGVIIAGISEPAMGTLLGQVCSWPREWLAASGSWGRSAYLLSPVSVPCPVFYCHSQWPLGSKKWTVQWRNCCESSGRNAYDVMLQLAVVFSYDQ